MRCLLTTLLLLGCLLQVEATTVYYSNGNKALEGDWTYTGITRSNDFFQNWQNSVAGWLTEANRKSFLINEFGQLRILMPPHLQPDGPCTIWRTDGSKWVEATYDHGILNGPVAIFFRDGSPELKATYVNGFPVGRYVWLNENGSTRASGTFSAYPEDEVAAVLLDNGNRPRKRKSYTFAQLWAGYSMLQWESEVIRLNIPGRRESTFEFSHSDGRAIGRMNYTKGVLDGESIQYRYGPLFRKAVFRMDSLVSVTDSAGRDMIAAARVEIEEANRSKPADDQKDPDGKPDVQTYPMGLKSGIVRTGGQPQPTYRVDVKSGIIYDPEGHKMFSGQWKLTGDFQHGIGDAGLGFKYIEAYRPSWLIHQLPVSIRPDGDCALWYPSGTKRADLHYDHGVLNGRVVFYNNQGNKELEAAYQAGFPVGQVVAYHRNGKVAFKGTYEPYRPSDLDNMVLYDYQKRLRVMYGKSASTLNKEAQAILLGAGGTIYRAPAGNKHGPFYYYDTSGKPALLVHYANDQLDGELIRFGGPEAGVAQRKFVYDLDSLVAAYDSVGYDRLAAAGRQDDSVKKPQPVPEELADPARRPIFKYVEQMPQFNGNLHDYLPAHLKYPPEVTAGSVTGNVVVRFVVNADGSVSDIRIVKSLSKVCDEEAIRLVREMPAWHPGRQNGKAVDVYYDLLVSFNPKE